MRRASPLTLDASCANHAPHPAARSLRALGSCAHEAHEESGDDGTDPVNGGNDVIAEASIVSIPQGAWKMTLKLAVRALECSIDIAVCCDAAMLLEELRQESPREFMDIAIYEMQLLQTIMHLIEKFYISSNVQPLTDLLVEMCKRTLRRSLFERCTVHVHVISEVLLVRRFRAPERSCGFSLLSPAVNAKGLRSGALLRVTSRSMQRLFALSTTLHGLCSQILLCCFSKGTFTEADISLWIKGDMLAAIVAEEEVFSAKAVDAVSFLVFLAYIVHILVDAGRDGHKHVNALSPSLFGALTRTMRTHNRNAIVQKCARDEPEVHRD